MERDGSYRDNKVKFPWLYSQPRYSVGDSSSSSSSATAAGLICGFSWPPRSYSCSFCRREFRSAQALGGHMNVHRRDRARLRQSPPWEGSQASNLNSSSPYPNPNPNQNHILTLSSPSPTEIPVPVLAHRFPSWLSSSFTCVTSSSPSSSSSGEARISGVPLDSSTDPPTSKEDQLRRRKAMKALFVTEEMKRSAAEGEEDADDADGQLLRKKETLKLDLEIGLCGNPPDNLDLELRLGFT